MAAAGRRGSVALKRAPGAAPLNAFSVDVEDYFQVAALENVVDRRDWDGFELRVERNMRRLLEIFERHGVRSTLFLLGWVAERRPRLVRDALAAGHELAVHGYDHRCVTSLTPREFRADVRRTKDIVEQIAGVEVIGYRAPNYSIVEETMWAMEVLLEEGFRYDSSIFPIHHDRYGVPRAPRFPWTIRADDGAALVEAPISTVRLAGLNLPFVGGGYLRHLPLWYILWGMRRVNEVERRPAIVYLHPWEIDPDQPRQPAGPLTRLRHYRNLHRTEERLEALFGRYRFTTVREVLGL